MMQTRQQRQLLVECSDPGLVISLTEELENVLRHIDFAQTQVLKAQFTALAQELGPDVAQAWQGFRLETPHDSGEPPSFGKRDAWNADAEPLQRLVTQAAAQGLGQWHVRETMLLPQGAPAPETREQYVRDLAKAIGQIFWDEWGVFQRPVPLPQTMAAYRRQLVDEHAGAALRAHAQYPTVGHVWINDARQRFERVFADIDTRAEAVMRYELQRLNPDDLDFEERVRWAVLAARLSYEVEKWYAPVEATLPHISQRAAWAELVWQECRGWGEARALLEARLQGLVAEAEGVYTADGVDALRWLYDDLRKPLFSWPGERD